MAKMAAEINDTFAILAPMPSSRATSEPVDHSQDHRRFSWRR